MTNETMTTSTTYKPDHKTIAVVYHSADFDGLFAGAVCKHWLEKNGHSCACYGWDFGDQPVQVDGLRTVYVVDLPVTCVNAPGATVIWIDHHRTSIESTAPETLGFRMEGVAACRLAWQWFQGVLSGYDQSVLPSIFSLQDFRDRKVDEPLALTLAGEYDVWDKSDPRAEQFQFGLTANGPWTPERLQYVFFMSDDAVDVCCQEGRAAMRWQQAFAKEVCGDRGYLASVWGLNFWTLASVHARNSMWFPNPPLDADALCCYRIEGDGNVKVSLYHAPGNEDIDLSKYAKDMGGGGHTGACGFTVTLAQAIELGIVK